MSSKTDQETIWKCDECETEETLMSEAAIRGGLTAPQFEHLAGLYLVGKTRQDSPNQVSDLKERGLIDKDGKITEHGMSWYKGELLRRRGELKELLYEATVIMTNDHPQLREPNYTADDLGGVVPDADTRVANSVRRIHRVLGETDVPM